MGEVDKKKFNKSTHTLKGQTLKVKANKVEYAYDNLLENIALYSNLDGQHVVQNQWMESNAHKAAILDDTITEIGIGISQKSKKHNRYYYCQIFGKPLK